VRSPTTNSAVSAEEWLTKRWASPVPAGKPAHIPDKSICSPALVLKRHLSFKHIDELILSRMRMAVGRLPAGPDPCHNHPVILQSCMVTEVAIVPIPVRGPERLWIARRVALLDIARIKRG
jgi:hypothetical protein